MMSKHIYDYDKKSSYDDRVVKLDGINTNWRLIDTYIDGELKIGVYAKTDSSHDWQNPLEYAIAIQGTDISSVEDWKNNGQQFLGDSSEHLKEAILYTKWFVNEKNDYEITFLGHSKGGGEAAVCGEMHNKKTMVFNPSVPDWTFNLKDEGYVTSYVVKNDILNDTFGELPLGETVYLPRQHNGWLPGISLTDRINNHSMKSVNNALREEGYR